MKLHFKFQIICKALERLLGWVYVIAYLDPTSNLVSKYKDSVLSLVFLLISNLTNGLRLHQFLRSKSTEANKSLKSDANRAH